MQRILIGFFFLMYLIPQQGYGQCNPIIGSNPDPANVCEDLTIQFSDNSTCSSLGRRWDFGDGSPTTNVQNPSHTFIAGNLGDTTYSVKLEKQDLNGNWFSTTRTVTVYKKPDASFTVSNLTACIIIDTLQFTNTSSMPAGNTVSWDFGDGSPLRSTENPRHAFNSAAASSYTVRLTVTNVRGCSRTASQEITVNEIPNPNFTMDNNIGCDPLEVTFTNTTVEGAFPVTDWEWNFAEQGSSTAKDPGSFTINGAAIYEVSLSATNTNGCTNTTTNTVVVKKTPSVSFDKPSSVCVGQGASVSYVGDGDPNATYNWNFENAQSVTGSGPGPLVATFAQAGTKNISLEILENGCSAEGSTTLLVNPLPTVAISSSDADNGICVGEEVQFTALPAGLENYTFFNDGAVVQTSASNQFTTTSLSNPNAIWVEAEDDKGCGSDASNTIVTVVNQKPEVTLSAVPEISCLGDTVVFTATGDFEQYTFDLGFVTVQSSASKVYRTTQLEDGDAITAFATELGCQGEASNAVAVTVQEEVDPPTINCASSTNTTVTINWDDDPLVTRYQLSVDNDAFYNPVTRATETITGLTPNDTVWFQIFGETNSACGNTPVSDSVFCIATPCMAMSLDAVDEVSVCQGDSVILNIDAINSPSSGYALQWAGGSFTKEETQRFVATEDTVVTVALIDSVQLGCPAYQHRFTVTVNTVPESRIESETTQLCEGITHVFTASEAGFDQYEYFLNGALVQDSAYHVYSSSAFPAGGNTLTLRTTEKGCVFTDSLSFNVVSKKIGSAIASAAAVCPGEEIRYTAQGNFDYFIFLETNTRDTLQDTTVAVLSVTDVYDVVVFGADIFGCLSTPDTVTVIEKPVPSVSLVSSATGTALCEDESVTFTASSTLASEYTFYRDYHILQSGVGDSYTTDNIRSGSFYYVIANTNGCASASSDSFQYTVSDTLFPPQVNCGSVGDGTLEVVWDAISGATGYRIRVDGAPLAPPSSGNTGLFHVVGGLNENDSIVAQVVATGPEPCGNSIISNSVTCYLACENPFSYEQNFTEGDFCRGDNVTLRISEITGGSGNYTIRWNGEPGNTVNAFPANRDTVVTVSVVDEDQPACAPVIKTFYVNVNPIPSVNLSGLSAYCSNEVAEFSATPTAYESYTFYDRFVPIADGANPTVVDSVVEDGHFYYVVATENGCTDTSNVITVSVDQELLAPNVYCGVTTTSSIDFEWYAVPGATGYEISINGFPYQTPSSGAAGLVHQVSGLTPGEVVTAKVRALGPDPCGASEPSDVVTCIAQECDKVAFEINRDTILCQGASLAVLLRNLESPSARYAFTWDGGLSYERTVNRTFTFNRDSVVQVSMIDSTQLNCPETEHAVAVEVIPLPVVDFGSSASGSEVCETDTITFFASSPTATSFTFYRDFFVLQDVGGNRYTEGQVEAHRNYYVVANSRGCSSVPSDSLAFNVSDTLTPPEVNCGSIGAGSLEVVWDSIPGAVGYLVRIDGGPFQVPSTGPAGFSHEVGGLNTIDSVIAEVIATGPAPCGNSNVSRSVKCYLTCENPFTFSQNFSEASVCEGDEVSLRILNLVGGTGDFTIRWNGGLGEMTETFVATKDTVIRVAVTDNQQPSCTPVTKTFRITVNPYPQVTLSGEDTFCASESATFTAAPASYDNYEFFDRNLSLANGLATSVTDAVLEDGHYYYVVATENGCSDTSNRITINVAQELAPPRLYCATTTTTSITFEWQEVPGATGYEISLDGLAYQTPSSGATGLTHEITGLMPEESIAATVRALGPAPCGMSAPSQTVTCFARACAKMAFEITPDSKICAGENIDVQIQNISSPSSRYFFSWNGAPYSKKTAETYAFTQDTVIRVAMLDSSQIVCPPTEIAVNITALPVPQVSLSSSNPGPEICENELVIFTATSEIASGFDFYQDYHKLVEQGGHVYASSTLKSDRNYFVVASAQGCFSAPSDTFVYQVSDTLVPPVVNCGNTSVGAIEIVWDSVPGASGYQIQVDNNDFIIPSTGINGLVHLADGLDENDSVSVAVFAVGPSPCGNSRVSETIQCFVSCDSAFTFEQNFTDSTFCAGDAVALNISEITGGTGGFVIDWNGSPNGTARNFTATRDTVVTVTVRDTNQITCRPVSKVFRITVNPIPVVRLEGESDYCSNEVGVFEALPTPYDNYEFFDRVLSVQNGLNPTLMDSTVEDGHYYSVVASNNGCYDTSNTLFVSVSPALRAPDLFCGRTTTSSIDFEWTAVPGALGYEISINGGPYQVPSSGAAGLLHEITGLSAGETATATVRAIGASPCELSPVSDTASCIAQNCEKVAFTISPDTTLCAGSPFTIALTNLESPSDRFGFVWDGVSATKDSLRTFTFSEDSTVSVTMVDSTQLNCPVPQLTVNISVNPIPEFQIAHEAADDTTCFGEDLLLTASTQGYDRYIFEVDGEVIQDSIASNFNAGRLSVGTKTIRARAENKGCSFTADAISLTVLNFPELLLISSDANDTICEGEPVIFTASPDFDRYAFYRQDIRVKNGPEDTLNVNNLQDGEEVYVIASTYERCFKTSEVVVTTVLPIPSYTLESSDADNIICDGDSITFTVAPVPVRYSLYNGSVLLDENRNSSSFTTDTLTNGNAIYIVGSNGGCTANSDTIVTTVAFKPTAEITAVQDSVCIGNEALATASGGESYLWSNGDTASTTFYTLQNTDTIWVQAIQGICTSKRDSAVVYVDNNVPNAFIDPVDEICRFESVMLTASGGERYRWVEGDSISDRFIDAPLVTPLQTDTFKVWAINDVCIDSATVIVSVDRCLTELPDPLPQIITPNGDGKNDVLYFSDVDYFTQAKLTVYNRWSRMVFEAEQYNNTWGGTSNDGKDLPSGTYFYVLDIGNGQPPYTNYIMIQR